MSIVNVMTANETVSAIKPETKPETKSEVNSLVVGNFGAGRYSSLGKQVFAQAQVVFALDEDRADKLARRVMSDFGAVMRNVEVIGKVSRTISKDGKVSLSEATAKVKTSCTEALFAMRALGFAADAGKFGFAWAKTSWATNEQLTKILDNL